MSSSSVPKPALADRIAPDPAVTPDAGPPPAGLARVELDVRAALAAGEEPFARIMSAARRLDGASALVLRSPFDPLPLHAVLARRGFARHTREIGEGDFETVYWRAAGAPAVAAPGPAPAPAGPSPDGSEVLLDVRGLMPPQPLERTLAALEELPDGGRLLQLNDRTPAYLLPLLEEQGWSYRIGADERGVLTTIWRAEG